MKRNFDYNISCVPPFVITHLGDLRRRGNNTERRARCGGRTGTGSHNNTLGSELRMNQSDKSSRVKNSLLLAEKLQLSGWVEVQTVLSSG